MKFSKDTQELTLKKNPISLFPIYLFIYFALRSPPLCFRASNIQYPTFFENFFVLLNNLQSRQKICLFSRFFPARGSHFHLSSSIVGVERLWLFAVIFSHCWNLKFESAFKRRRSKSFGKFQWTTRAAWNTQTIPVGPRELLTTNERFKNSKSKST